MTRRCAAKGCRRAVTDDAAGLLCPAHYLLLQKGQDFELDGRASKVTKAAIGEMRKAVAEEKDIADENDQVTSPEQRRWRMAVATVGFTALVLMVEAIERVRLGVPGGIGGLSWQSVDIAIDNALPVLVFLLLVWAILAVLLLAFGGVVWSVLRACLVALDGPRALLWSTMMMAKGAIWSVIQLNWLHGMIPYRSGQELAKREHTPTPAFDALLKQYRQWVQQRVDRVENWRDRWKIGPYLLPDAVRDGLVRFLDKGWYAGRITILLIVPSALGVGLISAVRVNELERRLTSADACGESQQKWYGQLISPLRLHVVCGQLVLDDKYPSLASGLGYDPAFVTLASSAKSAPTQFRSEQIAYIKDFGSWALVARPEVAQSDEVPETIAVRLLALLPINWDWVEAQLRRVSISIHEDGWVDRIAEHRDRIRKHENRFKPDPLIFAIDRARIVEFVKTSGTLGGGIVHHQPTIGNVPEPSLIDDLMPKRDRGKLDVIVAARTPDEWTQKLDQLTRRVAKQSEAFAQYQHEMKMAYHSLRADNGALAELAFGNLTNVQRLSQDVWRLGQIPHSTPVFCPVVRIRCSPGSPNTPLVFLPELTAVNSALATMREHLDDLTKREAVKLDVDTSALEDAVDWANEKLGELPKVVTVDLQPGRGEQEPDQYVFDFDVSLGGGWTFNNVSFHGEGRGPQSLIQTVFATCEPIAAATFPSGVWGLGSADWKVPISDTKPGSWVDLWSEPVDVESLVQDLKVGGRSGGRVFVIGSADQVGTPATNLNLSDKRAREVKRWVTEKIGWSEVPVTAISIGDMAFLDSGVLREEEADEWQRAARVFWCPNGDEDFAATDVSVLE